MGLRLQRTRLALGLVVVGVEANSPRVKLLVGVIRGSLHHMPQALSLNPLVEVVDPHVVGVLPNRGLSLARVSRVV